MTTNNIVDASYCESLISEYGYEVKSIDKRNPLYPSLPGVIEIYVLSDDFEEIAELISAEDLPAKND